MLAGTFVLGVLLGYLIWGWLRREVRRVEERLKVVKSIAGKHEVRSASLLMRLKKVEDLREHAESKLSLSEFRLARVQEELDELRQHQTTAADGSDADIIDHMDWPSEEEPTLADISSAMISSSEPDSMIKEDDAASSPLYHRGVQRESLEMAEQIFGKVVVPNDLQLIKGIGPKIEEVLHRSGIGSWAELAMANLPGLRQILEDAGPRYRIIDPKTWSIQARMAAKGEWRKLKAYQETLQEDGE